MAVRTAWFLVLALGALASASHEAAGDWGEVVLVQVLHRHGDRTPKNIYPTDPYNGNWSLYWPEGVGQLTKVGFESGYKLGTFLRSRYDQLLPRKYNMSSIRVRSTYSDRTLQTAECLLSGLYPPLPSTTGNVRWQPVPIFTVQPEQDYILKIPTCKLLDDVEDAVDDTDEMKCVEKRISKVKKYVKTVAGTSHWNHVFDAFRAEVSQNMTLPGWSSNVYPETLSSVWSWTRWLPTRLQHKLSSGNLIGDMTKHMTEAMKGSADDRKMYLYSAHDTTVVNFLSALQAFNFIAVPFTSAVILELRRRSPADYAVAVWYRNTTAHEPYLLTIDGCESICPFETFVNITSPIVPTNYTKECSEKLPKNYKVELLKPGKNPLWDGCI